MKLLLDTHILLWDINGDDHLSMEAEELINDPHNGIYYSAASIWEVAIKHFKHPDRMGIDADTLITYCDRAGFLPLDIKSEHVKYTETLKLKPGSPDHSDPFDRILISQAKAENMRLITHDKALSNYGEPFVRVV